MDKKVTKILKKPKAKIEPISSRKILRQFVNSNYQGVKEGRTYEPQSHPIQDRSNIFQNEFNKERKKMGFL
jgi:hypothetical protein